LVVFTQDSILEVNKLIYLKLVPKNMNFSIIFIIIIITTALLIVPHDSFAQTKHVSVPKGSSVPGCEETNECWVPAEITINVGDKVIWTVDDSAAHTVTSGAPSGPSEEIGAFFDSGLLLKGSTFSYTFEEVGTVDYFCMVHPWMQGVVSVGGLPTIPSIPSPPIPKQTPSSIPTQSSSTNVSIPSGSAVPGCEETNECWVPAEVTVDVGDKVIWSNDDSAAHTVTSGTPSDADSVAAVFDSGLLVRGSTFSYTFDEAGTVDYFCIIHPWMQGVVSVGGLPIVPSIPKITYFDSVLSLVITDGPSAGNIKVYPGLTDLPGNPLSSTDVEIYVDGSLKTVVSSNHWSNDIWAGSGSHTIRAVVSEISDLSDISVKYRSSSNSMPFTVKAAGTGSGFSSGSQSDEVFPIEYVIAIIVIAAGVGIVLAFSKRKKDNTKGDGFCNNSKDTTTRRYPVLGLSSLWQRYRI